LERGGSSAVGRGQAGCGEFPTTGPTTTNSTATTIYLLLDVYVRLNMFWASSRPSSGAQKLQ